MLGRVVVNGVESISTYDTGVDDRPLYYYCKRGLDLTLAMLLLLILAPIMALIAILIKIDSDGPVLFTQERVGARRRSRNGFTTWETRRFRVCKFRSMVNDADQSVHQAYIHDFATGRRKKSEQKDGTFKVNNDARITRIGAILRKTSLDELPQLFNVIKGEMSLIGPRPVPAYEVAEYKSWHHERLAALPGMTGLWQVVGRGKVSFDEMIQLDIEYVRHQSMWLDIKILLLTIPAVLSGRGAK